MIAEKAVVDVLGGMGTAGAIIAVLMSVVVILSGVIVWQQRKADKVYGYRLQERDALNTALSDSRTAVAAMAAAAKERNEITDDLADAIGAQVAAFARLEGTLALQHQIIDDGAKSTAAVVSSIAEAMRVLTSHVQEVRQMVPNGNEQVKQAVLQVVGDIKLFLSERGNNHKGSRT